MFRRFGVSVGILLILLFTGTVGYMLLEGWTWLDALYMTIITFTTVGYNEIYPLSTAGRIFNIFLIVGGVAAMLYFMTALMSHIVEEEIFAAFVRRRRMGRTLASMRRHYLLCGFGRVGREVGRAFAAEGVDFIVVDADENSVAEAQELGYAYIQGNATEDNVLRAAGIEHARGLVAVTGNDSDNVYITLSARGLNDKLQVVARTSDIANEKKLRRAGADKVISPLEIGGRRIAISAVRPLAADFADSMLRGTHNESLRFAEITIDGSSALSGTAIDEVVRRSNVEVLGLRQADGEMVAAPGRQIALTPGDTIFVIGDAEAVEALGGAP
ncbi:MAG: potassium channel protein [Chloroflexi bacterium]|nr:potassium channel protein [Chloroflexota bacterium]